MLNQVTLSVIIPTCHRNDLLALCLDRLAPGIQTLSNECYEVIVTDDGINSTAEQLILEKYPWAKWVQGPRKGPAANRNNGASKANSEWLVFVDDDCLPESEYLHTYLQAINKNQSVVVFEGYTYADREQQNFLEESPINTHGGFLWSCNFMIQKVFFLEQLNGFDEGYPFAAMEDVDLHYRILKIGCKPLFLEDAKIIHPWREQKSMYNITLKRFESTRYFIKKHPENKKQINSRYYFSAFIRSFLFNTVRNASKYKYVGLRQKLVYDFMQLYFAIKLVLKR